MIAQLWQCKLASIIGNTTDKKLKVLNNMYYRTNYHLFIRNCQTGTYMYTLKKIESNFAINYVCYKFMQYI